jgi:hypothetical protein
MLPQADLPSALQFRVLCEAHDMHPKEGLELTERCT